MNRFEPVPPKLFYQRVFFLMLLISLLQLFHLTVLSNFQTADLIVWMAVVGSAGVFIGLLSVKMNSHVSWPQFNIRLFSFLFLASWLVTLVFSRSPYVMSFLEQGMYLTRTESELGGGGWYSYVTIFFYPLAILLAFVNLKRKTYYVYLVLVMVIVLIDLLVIGTRGAPFFVLLFHVLMWRIRFVSLRSLMIYVGLFFALLLLVDYQTQARSLNTYTVGWDWVRTIRYSWIFDNLSVREATIDYISEFTPWLFPIVYLLQYITHSLAELRTLLFDLQYPTIGQGLYLKDEICLVARCERGTIHELISQINPRAGLYQTLYSSLFFDLGIVGTILLGMLLLLLLAVLPVSVLFTGIAIYLSMVIAVSGIENYIYNGLGLARFVAFVLLWVILGMKFTMRPRPRPRPRPSTQLDSGSTNRGVR